MIRFEIVPHSAWLVACSVLLVDLGCALDSRDVQSTSALDDASAASRDRFGLEPMARPGSANDSLDASSGAEFDGLGGFGDPGDINDLGGARADGSDASAVICTAGESTCISSTEALECSSDGFSTATLACEFACVGGRCEGECSPSSGECVSTTRIRLCGDAGLWLDPTGCDNACVDGECTGECIPGQTRCASTALVETCGDGGQWEAATPCQNACVGSACAGECNPGSTRCSSTTQQQLCSDIGQWQTPTSCENVCTGTSCGGECRPGTQRCLNDVTQQSCGQSGQFDQNENCSFGCIGQSCAACTPGTTRCLNDGVTQQTCGQNGQYVQSRLCEFGCNDASCAECSPGSTRCLDANTQQTCGGNGNFGQNSLCGFGCVGQGCRSCAPGSTRCRADGVTRETCGNNGQFGQPLACPFSCQNDACTECNPGDRRCSGNQPQQCNAAGQWQDQGNCAGGLCRGAGECRLNNGQACNSAAGCDSGNCVDGVCCQTACSGPCMSCRPGAGVCDIVPADDSACGVISCSFDPECATAATTSITNNRCSGLGRCKGIDDCGIAPRPQGTSCDTTGSNLRICDTSGTCVDPVVQCGVVACPVSADTACCARRTSSDGATGMTCQSVSACPSTTLGNALASTRLTCDEPSDCRDGRVCCMASAGNGSDISCRLESDCNTTGFQVRYSEACRSPSFTDRTTCPAGFSCTLNVPNFPGWTFCAPL